MQSSHGTALLPLAMSISPRPSCRTRTEVTINQTIEEPKLLNYAHLLSPGPILPLRVKAHVSTPKIGGSI
jgi:hypothetical protein